MVEPRIYPMGLHRDAKEALLDLVPEDKREEARLLLRTGEENAVIFARISRTAGSFDTIAAEVNEEGAAKFHQKWTVSVEGYGHASVGEHAIIQMAVENVSSADGDEITDNRLGSYTEFSARFSGRQTMTYFTPRSVAQDPDLLRHWDETHQRLFEISDQLTARGSEWISTREALEAFSELKQRERESEGAWRQRLKKHASDQFKNLLPASRLTSMGVTMNATETEHMLRKLLSSDSQSTREVGRMYKDSALLVAPTLVKYADFNPYLASLERRRESIISAFALGKEMGIQREKDIGTDFVVPDGDPYNPEVLILAAFAYESEKTGSYPGLLAQINSLSENTRRNMLEMVLSESMSWSWQDFEHGLVTSNGLTSHDMPPRAFEFDGGFIAEMPNMTYGDWRDYKRHRMQSYIAKPLDIRWGYMIPPMAELLDQSENKDFHGSVELVEEGVGIMEDLFDEVKRSKRVDARYAVTRLHYRPAIARVSAREYFHLLRLRTGSTAHPFVRRIMWPTYDELIDMHPNIFSHLKLRGEKGKIAFP